MKRRVVVFGTFDILHLGHLWFLGQAKRYGRELIVVVTRDARAMREKRKPIFNEIERLTLIASLKMVDKAVLGDLPGHWTMIKKLKPDIICLGYDQRSNYPIPTVFKKRLKIIKIKALNPKKYSNSRLRLRPTQII